MTSEPTVDNPVIPGFHPDPSVCRVGSEYFLATSSFTYFPGVPIFRSTDLVDWSQIGNVLDRTTQLDLSATRGWSSMGVYAPTLRHHDGRFWLITTNVTAAGVRSFLVTAEDPAGPWSDPVPVGIDGIDPDIAWDDDGNCWVTYAGIRQCRIDDTTGEILEGPYPSWSGTGLQHPEAPHLFRRGDRWYLLIAEGGTERGHAVSIARGPSPQGPWEPCPANPILSHRSTDRPIQNTGHADMVEAPDGSWWMVLLGVRPQGMTPGFHVLGRETFLTSVSWDDDGWPVVGPVDTHITSSPPRAAPAAATPARGEPVRDDFDAASLHPRWIRVRRPLDAELSLKQHPGWLTLTGTSATLDDPEPVFVARRQQHHQSRTRCLVDGEACVEAGLSIRMDERAHYDVAVRGNEVIVRARIGPVASVIAQTPKPEGPVVLGIDTDTALFLNPDEITLGFEAVDGFVALANLDGRYLSTEVTSGFIGRVIGMYAVEGEAAFDWFDYQGLN